LTAQPTYLSGMLSPGDEPKPTSRRESFLLTLGVFKFILVNFSLIRTLLTNG
jgi:hypothetical protein